MSIAGPLVRLNEQRIDDIAPLLLRTTQAITRLWPMRLRQAGGVRGAGVVAA